jgi:hypothetical protein
MPLIKKIGTIKPGSVVHNCNPSTREMEVLMVLVQCVIRRLPNSLCPVWKNPWQDMGV